ncbi:hypothetical protein BC829DRAFT_44637 [Chytridium lagenaria]|nr:hypothetical protein BC829DRAFT_44637 [Chytridium lagenaria]
MVRTKSGHAKAVRMMGMSEKEEANLFRRSVMPGTTVPSDQPIESPTDRRQTLSGLPQNFQPILGNDSDSDDSILPASLSRKKKRPVSTIKALRMMGLNESDHPQRSFRPMSMMTPPSSDGFQSPKALKIMVSLLKSHLQLKPHVVHPSFHPQQQPNVVPH